MIKKINMKAKTNEASMMIPEVFIRRFPLNGQTVFENILNDRYDFSLKKLLSKVICCEDSNFSIPAARSHHVDNKLNF